MDTHSLVCSIEGTAFFDGDWYGRRYEDVKLTGLSAAEHYVRIGARLRRDPGPLFSTRFYLLTHPDVEQAGVNPLWHYVAHGQKEGRRIAPSGYDLQPFCPERPVPRLNASAPDERPARVIAFYLPQFHPIAENDEWWGEGFTEWTNVRPALPQFMRHYQPHVPADLGYYDLRDTETQRRQIDLAKLYGVEGFCFYFYWFAGKRLLETPLLNYLNDPSLDHPFCLCWANENWSRRWDGRDHDVLMAQVHSPEDDLAFIRHVAQYMRDPRYIRVDGRPLLQVYRPSLLPDPAATGKRWRKWCRDNGLGEIYLAYTQSFESNDPADYGFDAAIEFPPNNSGVPQITQHCRPNPGFQGKIFDWSALVERSFSYASRPYTLFRSVCPSWDNTARRGVNGTVLANSTPSRFTRWVTNAIRETKARFSKQDQRLVFVNAWNEWAEGAHLEPDKRYGYAWLESVRVALACNLEVSSGQANPKVAIAFEARTAGGIPELVERCRQLTAQHKLFIHTVPRHANAVAAQLDASGQAYSLTVLPDRELGAPLLALLPSLRAEGFDFVLKMQDVSAMEVLDSAQTGAASAHPLESEALEQALASFAADATLGMLCPRDQHAAPSEQVHETLLRLGARLGLDEEEVRDHEGWRGRAFLARTTALLPLASVAIPDSAFKPGSSEYDPMMQATIERALTLSPIAAGLRVVDAANPVVPHGRRRVVIASHDAHPHGAQLLALNMARSFKAMGFDVDMLVLGPGRLIERFAEIAMVHRIDLGDGQTSRTLRLMTALRAAGAEVAIANTTVSGLLVPLLKRSGFQVVSLIHELPGVLRDYRLQAHARAIVEHADKVVFPARIVHEGFEAFVGTTLEQAVIRPQGLYLRNPHRSEAQRQAMRVEIREKLGLARSSRILLCVGYADYRKGLDLFAEACMTALAGNQDAVAVWVGHADQALLTQVQEAIAKKGFEHRFVFTGLVDNPQDYYAAADVYALTSREDPFPSVVMEALDARIPVVSFEGVVGSEELLARGAGLMVPAFDTGAMAQALSRLLDEPSLAAQLAERGHAIVQQEFSFPHYLFDLMQHAGRPLPKVSVVVPNYNYARYIGERLDSILQQTSPIYELIVLDDASTDNSVEVIDRILEDCSIPARLIVNDGNSGSVFKQWRRGVELARGDFVWIAEVDDLADPSFLDELLPTFRDGQVVLAYTQSRQMDSNGKILCEHYLDYVADIDFDRWTRAYKATGSEEISKALFVKNTIPNVSGAIFRRESLLRVLAEHQEEIFSYRNAGDWLVYLRLLEQGSVAFSPRSLNSHRRHQNSVTIGSFNLGQLQEIVRIQQDTIERHGLGKEAMDRADLYSQDLYRQFGLATQYYPHFRDHPNFNVASGVRG